MLAMTLAAVANLQASPMYATALDYGLARSATRACQRVAKRQGLWVRGQDPATGVTGSGGRLIGAEVILGVARRGQRYSVRCNYGINDRIARITPLNDRPTAPLTIGQQSCIAQGQRQGLVVNGSTSNRVITGSGGVAISEEVLMRVSRRGQNYQVRCNYGFRSRLARITPM